jgi:hypothetical protein
MKQLNLVLQSALLILVLGWGIYTSYIMYDLVWALSVAVIVWAYWIGLRNSWREMKGQVAKRTSLPPKQLLIAFCTVMLLLIVWTLAMIGTGIDSLWAVAMRDVVVICCASVVLYAMARTQSWWNKLRGRN